MRLVARVPPAPSYIYPVLVFSLIRNSDVTPVFLDTSTSVYLRSRRPSNRWRIVSSSLYYRGLGIFGLFHFPTRMPLVSWSSLPPVVFPNLFFWGVVFFFFFFFFWVPFFCGGFFLFFGGWGGGLGSLLFSEFGPFVYHIAFCEAGVLVFFLRRLWVSWIVPSCCPPEHPFNRFLLLSPRCSSYNACFSAAFVPLIRSSDCLLHSPH